MPYCGAQAKAITPRKTPNQKTKMNSNRYYVSHRTTDERIEVVARGKNQAGRMVLVSAAGHLIGVNDLWPEDAWDKAWRALPEIQHPVDAYGLPVSQRSISDAR